MRLLRSQPSRNEQGEERGGSSCQSPKPPVHTCQGKDTPLSPTPHLSVGHSFRCHGCRAPSGGAYLQLTAAHPCFLLHEPPMRVQSWVGTCAYTPPVLAHAFCTPAHPCEDGDHILHSVVQGFGYQPSLNSQRWKKLNLQAARIEGTQSDAHTGRQAHNFYLKVPL